MHVFGVDLLCPPGVVSTLFISGKLIIAVEPTQVHDQSLRGWWNIKPKSFPPTPLFTEGENTRFDLSLGFYHTGETNHYGAHL